jgi:hypothetical protein
VVGFACRQDDQGALDDARHHGLVCRRPPGAPSP